MSAISSAVLMTSSSPSPQATDTWINRAAEIGFVMTLLSLPTYSGLKYLEVYNDQAAVCMPWLAASSLVLFLLGRMHFSKRLLCLLTGLGYYCTSVLIFLSSYPIVISFDFAAVIAFICACIFMIPFGMRLHSENFQPKSTEESTYDTALKTGLEIVATAIYIVIGTSCLNSSIAITAISYYSVASYTMLFQGMVQSREGRGSQWLITFGCFLLVPAAFTAYLGDRYENLGQLPMVVLNILLVSAAAVVYTTGVCGRINRKFACVSWLFSSKVELHDSHV